MLAKCLCMKVYVCFDSFFKYLLIVAVVYKQIINGYNSCVDIKKA